MPRCLRYEPRCEKTGLRGFRPGPTQSDRTATEDGLSRGLKFQIKEVEGLYYPCSTNKGADQLHSYLEADMRLSFRTCKNPVFSKRGSYDIGLGSR